MIATLGEGCINNTNSYFVGSLTVADARYRVYKLVICYRGMETLGFFEPLVPRYLPKTKKTKKKPPSIVKFVDVCIIQFV